MIEKLVMLQTLASSGEGFGAVLNTLGRIGVFDFLLPFLIVFSLVFLILNGLKIFQENRFITAIIALAVGLMAMSLDFVPLFFQELFPRLGVGLGIILGLLIITGLFLPKNLAPVSYTLAGVGLLVGIIVFLNTAAAFDWGFGSAWQAYASEFWAWTAIIVLVAIIAGATKKTQASNPSLPVFVGMGSNP